MDAKHGSLPIIAGDSGASAIGPVCGMTVAKLSTQHTFVDSNDRGSGDKLHSAR